MNIIINGIAWEILETDTRNMNLMVDGNSCFGTCNHTENRIYIDESLSVSKKKATLKHELTHAFIDCCLLSKKESYTEEELCEFVSLYGKAICEIADGFYRGER